MTGKRPMGQGSVFLRASDGMWVAQVSMGPRHARRYRTKTLSDREPSERQKVAALAALRASAGAPAETKETTGAYLERWVNEARNIKDTTRHGYRMAIVTHVVPAIGNVLLTELGPRDIDRMLGRFEVTIGPKTARNAHAVVRRALGQAVRQGMIASNPAGREFVDAPRVPTREPEAYTEAEIAKLLTVAAEDRIGPLLTVAVETGLRQGELLGLAWEDVTADAVTVQWEWAHVGDRWQRAEPKTPLSRRTVPLSEAAGAAFAQQRTRVKDAGFLAISTGPVFINHRGKPLSGVWITHRLHELQAQAGIRSLPFKNLRTTFGTRLNERGVDEATIGRLMGHAPGSRTTRKHYIASSEAQKVAAIALLNDSPQSPNQSPLRGKSATSAAD